MSERIECDFLIIGGGTAGCVLAARLSEDASVQVVLVDAGDKPRSELHRMPAGVAGLLENKKTDWQYDSVPDSSINQRTFCWSGGKVLGGGSSMNGMIHMRGLASDFDHWDVLLGGNSGWSYKDLSLYFKKSENFIDRQADYLGHNGPMAISSARWSSVVVDRFLDAAQEMGLSKVDLNSVDNIGVGLLDTTIKNGRRISAYNSYLKPVMKRPNLRVFINTTVNNLDWDGQTIIGASGLRNNQQIEFRATKETLVSCGAIASPALLMRSGIGANKILAKHGIETRHNLSGVGRNLQEHINVSVGKYVNATTINSQISLLKGPKHVVEYYLKRRGMLAAPVLLASAYIKTSPELEMPDIITNLAPVAYKLKPDSRSASSAFIPKQDGITFQTYICRPKGRGKIRLNEENIYAKPIVDFKLLDHPDDMQTLITGAKWINELCETNSLKPYITGNCTMESVPKNDDEWQEYIRNNSGLTYHFSGTCKMGYGDTAVVDAQLKVHGVNALRVIDASIMPQVTSANINAPIVAIAEKAADLIRTT